MADTANSAWVQGDEMPGFRSSRHDKHAASGEVWSGLQQAPWRLRATCRCCEWIPPGGLHVVIRAPGPPDHPGLRATPSAAAC